MAKKKEYWFQKQQKLKNELNTWVKSNRVTIKIIYWNLKLIGTWTCILTCKNSKSLNYVANESISIQEWKWNKAHIMDKLE